MDIRTFYKCTRHKSTEDKIDLLITQVRYWRDNEAKGYEAYSRDDKDYYYSEAEHMRERARMLRSMIMQEINERRTKKCLPKQN